jgi:hypothetical protein
MRSRRVIQIVVAVATLVGPFAALAQNGDTVTTAPYVVTGAPAMGMPLLVLLAVLLGGVGAYLLRCTRGGIIAKVGAVAVLTALGGLAYAFLPASLTVTGAQCQMQTVQSFFGQGGTPQQLLSQCPNWIQIISIHHSCGTDGHLEPGTCKEGELLANGDSCTLPLCVPPG